MTNILLICTGNTCRSPMAEALLIDLIAKKSLSEQIDVSSAGISAFGGSPATAQAVEEMARRGLDLSAHRSRQLTADLIAQSDLILFMQTPACAMTADRFPQFAHKMQSLAAFAGEAQDVADPFGGSAFLYQQTADQILDYLEKGLPKWLKENGL